MSRSGNPRGLSRAFFASGGNESLEGAHRPLRQLPDCSLPLGSDGRNSLANHGCSESLGSAGIRASGGCLQPAPACRSCNSSQAIPPRTSPAGRALAMARSGGSSRRQSPRLDRAAREAALGSAKSEGNPDRDAKTADNARQESAEAQLQTQASNAQLQNQSNANAAKAPGPAALGQIEAKKMKAPAAPTVPSPQPGVAGGIASSYNDSASLQVARAIANPRLISP